MPSTVSSSREGMDGSLLRMGQGGARFFVRGRADKSKIVRGGARTRLRIINGNFMRQKITKTISSWLNSALRDDEAVYGVSVGYYEAVAVGN